ncbi:hypothetical protein SAMN06265218_102259 [Fodinibius sediminis]|uniref:ATP synthase I chain n=1 Tax=Fodinibius sediminis TaxID=1214077 RepID=A0A521B787_9BACT|nr:hypothetical protein SAMN06265218_102259 [Fodinibius sediminis]
MDERFRFVVYSFLRSALLVLAGTILVAYIWSPAHMVKALMANMLSFLFVASNFLSLRNFKKQTHKIFYRRFLIVLAVRFVFVLLALVLILRMIKFHQIYFTVSFIISYILHSIIEIILINKILQTDN